MKNISREIWKELRARRRALDVTLEELGEKVDLSVGFLSEIESGKKDPSLASFLKIIRALDLKILVTVKE